MKLIEQLKYKIKLLKGLAFIGSITLISACKTCNCPAYSFDPHPTPPHQQQIKVPINEPFDQEVCYQIFTVDGQMIFQTKKI